MKKKSVIDAVRCAMRNASAKAKSWPTVAVLTGPSVVIEVVVRRAEEESGIPMDWGYVGGRGMVFSAGDRAKCRRALFSAIPNSDLTEEDL